MEKIGRLIDDFWPDVGLGVSTLCFAVAAVTLSDEVVSKISSDPEIQGRIQAAGLWMLGASAFGQVVFFAFQLRRKARLSRLKAQLKDAKQELADSADERSVLVQNIRSLVEGYLVSVATGRLKFDDGHKNTDRITLYAHDPTLECFVAIGRFSYNPEYRRIRRPTYSDKSGCIARAWQHGAFFDNGFPDPATDHSGYLKHHEQYGYESDIARQLTMHSRLYYGYRVMDTSGRDPLAIVVVESTDATKYTENQLQKVFANDERRFMADLLEVLAPHFSVPGEAQKAGF